MLAQDANSGDGHYGLGLVLADQQNYQGAIEEFKKAAASGTQISGINYEMGNAYAKLKMYDDAISSYLKSKERDGDDPDMENALADAYQAKGMAAQAQDARKHAAELKSGTGH
jgi:tetratricopeptide (TPR) repeat protein